MRWLPVDQYIGGIEHAILHLALFPVLHPRHASDRPLDLKEPFRGLFTQGMVVHETYKGRWCPGRVALCSTRMAFDR
jgi:leucyl-tRNA synthetase